MLTYNVTRRLKYTVATTTAEKPTMSDVLEKSMKKMREKSRGKTKEIYFEYFATMSRRDIRIFTRQIGNTIFQVQIYNDVSQIVR
jgi:hypothetical protein